VADESASLNVRRRFKWPRRRKRKVQKIIIWSGAWKDAKPESAKLSASSSSRTGQGCQMYKYRSLSTFVFAFGPIAKLSPKDFIKII
jgi:hypothetical protein